MRIGSQGIGTAAILAAVLLSIALLPGGHAKDTSVPVKAWVSSTVGKTLRVKASAAGLYPSARRPLRVVVVNPHRFAVKVTSVTVRVLPDLRRRRCRPAQHIRVSRLRRALPVPRRRTGSTILRISMLGTAPNACRGASFPLRVTATARKS